MKLFELQKELEAGKKIRRQNWEKESYIMMGTNYFTNSRGGMYIIYPESLFADNWEVVPEEEKKITITSYQIQQWKEDSMQNGYSPDVLIIPRNSADILKIGADTYLLKPYLSNPICEIFGMDVYVDDNNKSTEVYVCNKEQLILNSVSKIKISDLFLEDQKEEDNWKLSEELNLSADSRNFFYYSDVCKLREILLKDLKKDRDICNKEKVVEIINKRFGDVK